MEQENLDEEEALQQLTELLNARILEIEAGQGVHVGPGELIKIVRERAG